MFKNQGLPACLQLHFTLMGACVKSTFTQVETDDDETTPTFDDSNLIYWLSSHFAWLSACFSLMGSSTQGLVHHTQETHPPSTNMVRLSRTGASTWASAPMLAMQLVGSRLGRDVWCGVAMTDLEKQVQGL